jgi:hypothetical protein
LLEVEFIQVRHVGTPVLQMLEQSDMVTLLRIVY